MVNVGHKTLWTLWYQGFETAPEIVRLCLDSWRRFNPEWNVVALDRQSLAGVLDLPAIVDVDRKDLTVQKISNIVRLCLLREHGGIWVDATVYCCKPLARWLPEYSSGGFFAFRNPGPDRLMSNWFIAAERDNQLLDELHRAFLAIWQHNYYFNQNNRFGRRAIKALSPWLNRTPQATRFWLSFPVRRILGAYPFFQFHYVFNRLIFENERCREIWAAGKALDSGPPHRLQHLAHQREGLRTALAEIDQGDSPVYKLNWRVDPSGPYWGPVMKRLRAALSDPARLDQPDLSRLRPW